MCRNGMRYPLPNSALEGYYILTSGHGMLGKPCFCPKLTVTAPTPRAKTTAIAAKPAPNTDNDSHDSNNNNMRLTSHSYGSYDSCPIEHAWQICEPAWCWSDKHTIPAGAIPQPGHGRRVVTPTPSLSE